MSAPPPDASVSSTPIRPLQLCQALGLTAPYSYRVLTPWLTRALSSSGADADLRSTYRAIALGCLVVTGVLVYLLVRRLGGSHPAGLLAVGGLCCSWGWLIYLQAPYLSDQAAVLLTAAAFAALTFGAVEAIPVLLTVMALTREAFVGFALPMIGWLWPQDGPLKAVLRSAAAVASALVCYLLLLRLAPVAQRGREPVSAYLRRAAVTDLAHAAQRPAFTIAVTFTGSLGIWWLLGVAGWRSARGLWWWLLPVFGAFLFGGDWSRFAFYAFPVIVPAGAIAVWQHRHRWLLLGLLALQAAVPLVDLAVDGKLLLNRQQPSLELTVLLAVLTLPALLWPIRRSRGEEALSRLGLSSPHIGKEDAGQDGYQRV